MIKDLIHWVVLTIINIYVPKQQKSRIYEETLIELKGEKDNSTIIVGDTSTSLSVVERIVCRR